MLVLGLDTATAACTVALCDGHELLAEFTVMTPRGHSAMLMPLIDQVVRASGRPKKAIGAVAAGIGPGSFTGLRIGLAAAKSIAFALDVQVVPVCTLAAIAYGLGAASHRVAVLLDARRGEVYAALYSRTASVGGNPAAYASAGTGLVEDLAPRQEPLTTFLARLDAGAPPITLAGDAGGALRAAVVDALGDRAIFAPGALAWPRGWAVAALGSELLSRGGGVAPDALLPLYMRATEAERRQAGQA